MIEQIETIETQAVELNLEDLDLVHGGVRKAGKEQQEYLTAGDESIIAIL